MDLSRRGGTAYGASRTTTISTRTSQTAITDDAIDRDLTELVHHEPQPPREIDHRPRLAFRIAGLELAAVQPLGRRDLERGWRPVALAARARLQDERLPLAAVDLAVR